jgi:hypothetical protein
MELQNMAKEADRVQSFSVKPEDFDTLEELRKLREHAKKTGRSFSFLVIQAIKKYNKELFSNG